MSTTGAPEPQHPQPEPAPSEEEEREALSEVVRSWAVAHGFSTDASAFVYEDGETERDIIADLGTLLAAAGFHRTEPEKSQPDHAALIAEARGVVNLAESLGASDKVVKLVARLADALEGKPHGT